MLTKAGTLTYTKGAPKYFVSSTAGKRRFCEMCGSQLVWQASDPAEDWMTNLCVGSLDNPAEARVTCHIHADTRLPWYDVCPELPKFTEKDEAAMMAFIRP